MGIDFKPVGVWSCKGLVSAWSCKGLVSRVCAWCVHVHRRTPKYLAEAGIGVGVALRAASFGLFFCCCYGWGERRIESSPFRLERLGVDNLASLVLEQRGGPDDLEHADEGILEFDS